MSKKYWIAAIDDITFSGELLTHKTQALCLENHRLHADTLGHAFERLMKKVASINALEATFGIDDFLFQQNQKCLKGFVGRITALLDLSQDDMLMYKATFTRDVELVEMIGSLSKSV